MEANAVDGIEKADIKEVRLCRAGQYFPGKLCSAFLIFEDRSKAEMVFRNWDARAVPNLTQTGTSLTCKVEPGECSARPNVFAQSSPHQKDDGGQKTTKESDKKDDAVPSASREDGGPPPHHGKGDQAGASRPLFYPRPKPPMTRMTAPPPQQGTSSSGGCYHQHPSTELLHHTVQ